MWMDNIKTWTGLPVEESIRMTEDSDKWRKNVRDVVNPRGQLKNRIKTELDYTKLTCNKSTQLHILM